MDILTFQPLLAEVGHQRVPGHAPVPLTQCPDKSRRTLQFHHRQPELKGDVGGATWCVSGDCHWGCGAGSRAFAKPSLLGASRRVSSHDKTLALQGPTELAVRGG